MKNTLQVTEIATVSMTSLEIVEFINSRRPEGSAELRHADFMAKVPKVLGEVGERNFSFTYFDSQNKERPCYRFPKRESMLMAMSYDYAAQAAIYDRWQELEIQVHQSDSKRLAILEERNCQLINDLSDSMAHILGTKNQITSAKRQMRAMKAALVEYVDERVIDLRETAMDLRANGQAQASNELIQVVSAMLKDVKKIAVPSDPSLLEYAYISENLLHRYVVEKVDLLLRKRIKNPRIQDLNTSLGLSMADGLDFL